MAFSSPFVQLRMETLEDRITPAFGPTFNLGTLTAATGLTLNGFENNAQVGETVGDVGDVNADGIADFALLAPDADGGGTNKGQAYIVFGTRAGFPATLALNALDGTNGFTITGKNDNDQLGEAEQLGPPTIARLGDINGDGIDDVILGAGQADGGGINNGEAYVIYGSKSPFPATFDLNTLNGANGFTIVGGTSNGELGRAVSSAGDLNGDGKLDIIVGAPDDGNGKAYVIFGAGANLPASINVTTLAGTTGFSIEAIANDDLGESLASLGDVNGDGIDDIIVGAGDVASSQGAAYIIFGSKAAFPAVFNVAALNGINGFSVNGALNGDDLGEAVSRAGDFNGDGLHDILIGAEDAAGSGSNRGEAYVIFGNKAGYPAAFNLATLNGIDGFRIFGLNNNDNFGTSLGGGRDVNSDGLDDIIIGASGVDNGGTDKGAAYVIFGTSAVPATFDLATLDGKNGFVINGINNSDNSGAGVTLLGDVNNDGTDDILVGAYETDLGGTNKGQAYVVFGTPPIDQSEVKRFAVGPGPGGSGIVSYNANDGSQIFTLDALPGTTGGARTATADVNGDGVADLIVGSGPGIATSVRVFDGATKAVLFTVQPFEAGFTGGVYVAAADFNGDGKADVIVTPDEGGGPVVVLYEGAKIAAGISDAGAETTRYFGIDDPAFRGGARPTAADFNGDGIPDLAIAAGFSGGPRVALYNGKQALNSFPSGSFPEKLLPDFFMFEETLRNGAFISAGDITGDGKAELITAGGPGGGPRVRIIDGATLLTTSSITTLDAAVALTPSLQIGNFFAGDASRRGGVRVAVKDLDGDRKLDLLVGSGNGDGSKVTAYSGSNFPTGGTSRSLFVAPHLRVVRSKSLDQSSQDLVI